MPSVVVDCFPSSVAHYRGDHAIVAVDVFRATTTAVTAVAAGRACYPAASLDEAVELARTLENPLLVGELGGSMPYGFDQNNSPAKLERRDDVHRPVVLLTSSGTELIAAARGAPAVFAAALRNHSAQAEQVAGRYDRVAVIGAGTRLEFREEDQLCCGWIAARLVDAGYEPENAGTRQVVDRWRDEPIQAILRSASVEYLRSTGQEEDVDFVLSRVDDVDAVFAVENREIVRWS
jgi:2-phosphosulfolactate phosphatase